MPTPTEATYAAGSVDIVFGAVKLSGYADGTFITVKRSEVQYKKKIGADGKGARSRMADKSMEIEVTLMSTSPSNDYLTQMSLADEAGLGVAPFQMTNRLQPGELAHAEHAWVAELPQTELEKEVGEKKWVFHTLSGDLKHGGNPGVVG